MYISIWRQRMTLTELRKNIYSVFDEVIKTGKTIEIQSKGKTVSLSPGKRVAKLERLKKAALPQAIIGNPDDLIHLDWEKEWQPRHI